MSNTDWLRELDGRLAKLEEFRAAQIEFNKQRLAQHRIVRAEIIALLAYCTRGIPIPEELHPRARASEEARARDAPGDRAAA